VAGLDGRSLVASGGGGHRAVEANVATSNDNAYSEEEEQAVFEHLKGLGYVD
jgi:hypothetical protein